jgi:hypothetical protein
MNFDDFLNVLMKLSVKVFRRVASTKDQAFEIMLGTKILPLASRRFPEDVTGFMTNLQVMQLFDYYEDALKLIFGYYASSDRRTHSSTLVEESSPAGGVRVAGSRDPASASYKPMNSMKEAMTYAGAWQRAPWALRPLLHSPHPHLPALNPAALSLSLSLSLFSQTFCALPAPLTCPTLCC